MKTVLLVTISFLFFFSTMAQETTEKFEKEIFLVVEDDPIPIGGMKEYNKFLSDSINYPIEALKANIKGNVYVELTINKEGEVEDPRVLKGIGGGCDEEAIRVIMLAPKWIPGKQKGKPVYVRKVVTVAFKP
jgi:periplasmic protein TonB